MNFDLWNALYLDHMYILRMTYRCLKLREHKKAEYMVEYIQSQLIYLFDLHADNTSLECNLNCAFGTRSKTQLKLETPKLISTMTQQIYHII